MVADVVVAKNFEMKKYFEVIKSENDPRKYRFIELENRLKILLISDELADKAATSVDVKIGLYYFVSLLVTFLVYVCFSFLAPAFLQENTAKKLQK